MSIDDINEIEKLLPNREKVFHYIWDTLQAPLDPDLESYLRKNIGEFGTWKEKHLKSGDLYFQGWAYKGEKQGHWIYNFKNGAPHRDCYYRNGEFHGVCKIWDVDGSYEITEYYKGKINGYRDRYNSEGKLYQKWLYEMGHYKECLGPVELGLNENAP
jgi:hypothetical protein